MAAPRLKPLVGWFLLIDGIYCGLFLLNLWHPSSSLEWILVLAAPLLIFLIPFLFGEKGSRTWCAVLAMVPIAGDVACRTISEHREEARHKRNLAVSEARLVEQIRTDPGDIASAIGGAGENCRQKSAFVALEAEAAEAALAAADPGLAPTILNAPAELSARIPFYEALGQGRGAATTPISHLLELLRRQRAYLNLAAAIQELQPAYQEIRRLSTETHPGEAARTAMRTLAERFREYKDLKPAAGYFNQLAMIAAGGGDLGDARNYLFAGREADPDHFPLYETLAYLLWIQDHQGEEALAWARRGLALAQALPGKIQAERAAIEAAYDTVAQRQSGLQAVARRRREELALRYPALAQQAAAYSSVFVARFQLDIAYFSALTQTNEAEAKALIAQLAAQDPEDPDYRETRGFVTMMFAQDNPADLTEALADIGFAIYRSPPPTANILVLYCAHYQECLRRQAALAGK